MNPLRPFAMLFVGLVVSQFAATGRAELANRKETLEGHRSIFLSVNIPKAEEAAQQLGLKKESLERFLIDRLKKGGVAASLEYIDQTLILEIQVDLVKVIQAEDSDVYAFISQFEAIQPAQLATNRKAALVTTWRSTRFGVVSPAQQGLLRDSVLDNLERFLNDFHEAQSKSNRPND